MRREGLDNKGCSRKKTPFLKAFQKNTPFFKKGGFFLEHWLFRKISKKPAFQKITPFFELLVGKSKMTGGGKKDFNPVKSPLLTKREVLPL